MINTDDLRFVWTADADGDGVPETERFNSTSRAPDIDRPDGGRSLRASAFPTLDGGSLVLAQGRSGYADQRAPGRFSLSWNIADEGFLRIAEEDFAKGRIVEVRLDHRWRQLRVTSSGLADLTVTVEAGYLLDGGDVYWLAADADLVCGGSDTYVYATPVDGALTVDSGTSVPEGSVELAAITIADSIVTVVSDPSGVANARIGKIVEFTPDQAGGGYTGLSLVIEEIR